MPTRDLIVNLVGRTDKLTGPLDAMSGKLQGVGRKLTSTLTPAAGAAGVGLGLAAKEFNAGADALRVGAGATGGDLAKMTDQMKSVAGNATLAKIGMGRVGEIMADVNTTTGATGETLELLTTRFGQLERMGQGASVQNVSRVFGDWGVATEDQVGKMDQLFRAAQASGATVDELSSRVVQFGAPLRNLGFGFEDATGLIASFQKNGVNLETVMGGLRQGIGKLAREGEDVPTTFRRVVDEIANAESASESTRLAIELFGQRAGPDLADAIRNGQFSVEDMVGAISDGTDTIDQAANDTTRLSDKMAALKNRAIGTLGPFGEMGAVMGGALASLGPLMMGLGSMGPLLAKVGTAVKALTTALMANPWLIAIAAIIAAAILIYKYWDEISAFLAKTWNWIKSTAESVWGAILGFFKQWWPLLIGIFTGPLGLIVALIIKHWDEVWSTTKEVFGKVVDFFKEIPGRITGALGDLGSLLVDAGKDLLGGLMDGVEWVWKNVVKKFYVDLPLKVLEFIGDVARTLYDKGRDLIDGLLSGARWLYDNSLIPYIVGIPGRVVGAIGNLASTLLEKGKDLLRGLRSGIKWAYDNSVLPYIVGIPGKIVSKIGEGAGVLIDLGKSILGWIKQGMVEALSSLGGFFRDLVNMMPGWMKSLLGIDNHGFGNLFGDLGDQIGGIGNNIGVPGGGPGIPQGVGSPLPSYAMGSSSVGGATTINRFDVQVHTNDPDALVRALERAAREGRLGSLNLGG